jgi:hypothetical protein
MSPDIHSVASGDRARYATYDSAVAHFEREVIHRVNADLHGQDPSQVYRALVDDLHGRLPGVDLDERNLWSIAGAISTCSLPEQV